MIYFSLAYLVEVSRNFSCSGVFFKCLIFCLQLSICQQLMQSTSRFDFVLMTSRRWMKSFHSFEFILSMSKLSPNSSLLKYRVFLIWKSYYKLLLKLLISWYWSAELLLSLLIFLWLSACILYLPNLLPLL